MKRRSINMAAVKKEIIAKVQERNRELGFDYYSENIEDYVYVDTIPYEEYDLMYFICKKSKSSISIRV